MANIFASLAVPAGNGVGVATSTSGMGAIRTITVEGTFTGGLSIQVSLDAGTTWSDLVTFGNSGEQTIRVAADSMRVSRAGVDSHNPGSPTVDVGSDDNSGTYTALAAPAGNGTAAASSIATHGQFQTAQVGGTFTGSVIISVSEDGVDYADMFTFSNGGIQSISFIAQFAQVTRAGVDRLLPGLPVINLGAINDASAGGGAPTGPAGGDLDGTYPNPDVIAAHFGGSAGTRLTFDPVADQEILYRNATAVDGITLASKQYIRQISGVPTAVGLVPPTVVYNPSGTAAGNVFTSWPALMIELARIDGPKRLVFAESVTVPVGGPYDMNDVVWSAVADSSSGPTVIIPTGCSFTNLRTFDGVMTVESQAAVSPVSDFVTGDRILVSGTNLYSSVAAPFFSLTGAGKTVRLQLENGCTFGDATNDAIEVTAASTLAVIMETLATLRGAAISGAAGATLSVTVANSSSNISGDQTGFLGTESVSILCPPRWSPRTASASPVAVSFGESIQLPSTPYTVTLPALFAPYTNGRQVKIRLATSGTGVITVTPNGADTINLAASFTMSSPTGFETVTLEAFGTNWGVVYGYLIPLTQLVPEVWAVNQVPISQTDVAMSTAVSQLFDTWTAIRAGSVVGLRTKFDTPVTAGTLTLTVAVNGTPGTLAVVSTSGSNASGGVATQVAGVNDTFAASGTLSVVYTSSGTFAPITLNMEAYLEIYVS